MKSVLVLLATYQGEKFLKQQLDSIANQSVDKVHILVSDDGSTDGSMQILEQAKQSWTKGKFNIVHGPQNGVAENFCSLILDDEIKADYYAFSDQDDIWDKDKLEKAINWSAKQDATKAHTYAARTRVIDENGKPLGLSMLFNRPASFNNALVQSIAGGNTMVLNHKAFELIKETVRRTNFVSHDWWIYQIITGANGVFYYDLVPSLSYRQHDDNLVGANNTFKARLVRIKRGFGGQMWRWGELNISGLEKCSDLLTPQTQETIAQFKIAHKDASILKRLKALRRSGVYRQTKKGQISMYIACVLKLL